MNKKILSGVIVILLTLAVAGCSYQRAAPMAAYDEGGVGVEKEAVSEAAQTGAPGRVGERTSGDASDVANDVTVERLIIRNASLDLVVPDTEAALAEINDVVNELDGYVVESNVYQYQEGLQAYLTLRIPAEKLDLALERFRGLATEVRSENVSGQDVTQEYVDLQSYLRNREAVQARLLEYLEEAETTEDALAVDTQLRQIEAEIEQTKGRIQYLEQSAAMSQVTLTLTPDELAQPIQVGGWHPEGTLRNAFQSLVRVLQFLVDAAIVIVVLVLPVVLVIAAPIVGLFFLIRVLVRRRRARKAI
jgi:hypothetical protein